MSDQSLRIRISKDAHTTLKRLAARENRTVSAQARVLLEGLLDVAGRLMAAEDDDNLD